MLNEAIWKELLERRQRGIKIRAVSEVTKENIQYCKKFMEVVELRHLDGLKSNFALADGKFYYYRLSKVLEGLSHDYSLLFHRHSYYGE